MSKKLPDRRTSQKIREGYHDLEKYVGMIIYFCFLNGHYLVNKV